MKSIIIYTLITVLVRPNLGAPFALNEIFPEFVMNTKLSEPAKQQEIVKRQVIPANPDAQLKQISLNGLIGDLENSLFQSAFSVHSAHKEGAIVEEVTPPSVVADKNHEHEISKRDHTTETPEGNSHQESTTIESKEAEARRILLQTTKKVPESGGVPAHFLIDRISVLPYTGGVPLIPSFQVQHTKVISATIKEDPNSAEKPVAVGGADKTQTHISITKTSITATSVEGGEGITTVTPKTTDESTTTGNTEATTLAEPTSESNTSTTAKSENSSTTKEPHEKVKSAEEKLKEKVAEIEAEPIILSARV